MKLPGIVFCMLFLNGLMAVAAETPLHRYLYVAVPGVRNYLEHGGHGVLVFDMDAEHRWVRRIPMKGLGPDHKPSNVKGVCASAATGRLYVSTLRSLQCVDLKTDRLLWEREYDGGCDRMSISPDGVVVYLPSLEREHWHVVSGESGDILKKLIPNSKAHNTVCSPDGREFYLAGLGSPILRVADAKKHELIREVGPMGQSIRPFTVNGSATRAFCCVNDLLGFEIADLKSGKLLERVVVNGFEKGPVKRHGCPSHGIGLTPDESELWLCDATNQRMHVFDLKSRPPRQVASIRVKDEPGWITFSLDGRTAYPSTGDIIDVASRRIVGELRDETGVAVMSEKMVEVQMREGRVSRCGDQFGLGRVPNP